MSSIELRMDVATAQVASGSAASLGVVQTAVQVSLGLRGPPGSDALAGGVTSTALNNISGHVAAGFTAAGLVVQAIPATVHPIGVTSSAAMAGLPATVVTSGPIDEPSWSWVPGPVYVSVTGSLTQASPTTGDVYVAGESAGPTRLIVSVRHVATLAP